MKNQGVHILVIEDHDASRHLLGAMLGKYYKVTTKKDGLEGLAWLSNGFIPDLIILDIQMPGMNGIEFLKGIRNSGFFRRIPVLVLSASDDPAVVEQLRPLGVREFISKPFNPLEIVRKIDSLLARLDIAVG